MKRRDFLHKSALASAGLLASTQLISCTAPNTIDQFGFQVYTVRDVIKKDMLGTLIKLKQAGYDYAEFFDFVDGKLLGRPVKEAKSIIETSEIKLKSIHVSTGALSPSQSGTLTNNWQQGVDDASELGAEYLVCAYLAGPERKTIDQYKQLCDLFNRAGEICQKSGIQFAYHNHDFEFDTIEGQVPFDILLNETDEGLVKMELDIYWAKYANQNPIEIFGKDKGRYPLWHVKDLIEDEKRMMTEVGKGVIDWAAIFNHQKQAGMNYFFVEQDSNWASSSVDSLIESIDYLKKLNF